MKLTTGGWLGRLGLRRSCELVLGRQSLTVVPRGSPPAEYGLAVLAPDPVRAVHGQLELMLADGSSRNCGLAPGRAVRDLANALVDARVALDLPSADEIAGVVAEVTASRADIIAAERAFRQLVSAYVTAARWDAFARARVAPLAPAVSWLRTLRAALPEDSPGSAPFVPAEVTALARRAAILHRTFFGSPQRDRWNARSRRLAASAPVLCGQGRGSAQLALSQEQREAAVLQEPANLVVASAGSGKTATLAARCAWLIDACGVPPEEILILCFGRAAARSMQDRIRSVVGEAADGVTVSTFHAMGRHILVEELGRPITLHPRTLDDSIGDTVRELLAEACQSRAVQEDVELWLADRGDGDSVRPVLPYRFLDRSAYERASYQAGYRSLGGVRVRAYEDRQVADVLSFLDVPFRVVRSTDKWIGCLFVFDEGPAVDADDIPPDAAVLWTVPGGRDGRPVGWSRFRAIRRIRQARFPRYAEVPAWRIDELPIAREAVAKALVELDIPFRRLDFDGLASKFDRQGPLSPLERLIRTLTSFVRLYKARLVAAEAVKERLGVTPRGAAFWRIAEAVYRGYERLLAPSRAGGTERVDFADYLSRASLEAADWKPPWSEVLVDEYQDALPAAIRLLRVLQQRPARLYCVGDDWQSIFTWNGTDPGVIRSFPADYGREYGQAFLSTTYRCSAAIARVGTAFIMRNPLQVSRQVRAAQAGDPAGVVALLPYEGVSIGDRETTAIRSYLDAAMALAPPAARSVLVLGRYQRQRDRWGIDDDWIARWAEEGKEVAYMTVHGAKGLEADHVVILDVSEGAWGFPSEQHDDSVLAALKATPDPFPWADERRLFYVALTRARHRVVLLARHDPSVFLQELLALPDVQVEGWAPSASFKPHRTTLLCDRCGGELVGGPVGTLRWCEPCGEKYPLDVRRLERRFAAPAPVSGGEPRQ